MCTEVWIVGISVSDGYNELYGIQVDSVWLSEREANQKADRLADADFDKATAMGWQTVANGWEWFRSQYTIQRYPIHHYPAS